MWHSHRRKLRRTKLSVPNLNFGSYVRQIFTQNIHLLTRNPSWQRDFAMCYYLPVFQKHFRRTIYFWPFFSSESLKLKNNIYFLNIDPKISHFGPNYGPKRSERSNFFHSRCPELKNYGSHECDRYISKTLWKWRSHSCLLAALFFSEFNKTLYVC